MESKNFEVLIIGAGAAGLAAALRLSAAGRKVAVLEARERIGGRILTIDAEGQAVELGAEFIHGKVPVIVDLVARYGLKTIAVHGDQFCNFEGRISECEFFDEIETVFDQLTKYSGPDISFEEFVKSASEKEGIRQHARSYVAGFHGAPPDDAGVKALIDDTKAEEELESNRSSRIEGGYRRLVDCMWNECEKNGAALRFNTRVERVEWADGIRVFAAGQEFHASKLVITLPISMLKDGDVVFDPPLHEKQKSLDLIAMGDVARCVLSFSKRWWENLKSSDGKSLKAASFMFSSEQHFPTWWTQAPTKSPTLVAWASALTAPALTGKSQEEIANIAVQTLSRIVNVNESLIRAELVSAHWHDWYADPLARGAYTYAKVGGSGAYRELATPIGEKLFFAGEATDSAGNHATVHGAIASGYRVADEILALPLQS